VKLKPVNNSDQPIWADYTTLNVEPVIVYLGFWFLESQCSHNIDADSESWHARA
jgi:hypothetical protein